MPRRAQARALLLLVTASGGCTDVVPTVVSGDRIPIRTEMVELHLPFSAFASDLRTHAGFGSASELAVPIVANQWAGELDAHLLIQFGELPRTISVLPPGATSGAQADSTFHAVRGEVVLRWDTTAVAVTSSFRLEAEAILTDWDPRTATWELAADTLGGSSPWPRARRRAGTRARLLQLGARRDGHGNCAPRLGDRRRVDRPGAAGAGPPGPDDDGGVAPELGWRRPAGSAFAPK